mgnify:CR=1 FL=1
MRWRKSSYSSNPQGCVQVRVPRKGMVEIGDTRESQGPTITVPHAEWESFLNQVVNGERTHGSLPSVPLPAD